MFLNQSNRQYLNIEMGTILADRYTIRVANIKEKMMADYLSRNN